MLVYAKNPDGILYFGNFRIYGSNMIQGPRDVPFEFYKNNKDVLEDATYREGVLNKIFDSSFPEVAFTYQGLRFLPHKTLDKIGKGMRLEFGDDWTIKRKVEAIKQRIRDVSPRCL
jgi:hypothetical protein